MLDLDARADRKQVAATMQNHIVGSATLVGLCEGTKAET